MLIGAFRDSANSPENLSLLLCDNLVKLTVVTPSGQYGLLSRTTTVQLRIKCLTRPLLSHAESICDTALPRQTCACKSRITGHISRFALFAGTWTIFKMATMSVRLVSTIYPVLQTAAFDLMCPWGVFFCEQGKTSMVSTSRDVYLLGTGLQ
jgi:hypothetical protein